MDISRVKHELIRVEIPGKGIKLLPIDPIFLTDDRPMVVKSDSRYFIPTRDPKYGISLQNCTFATYKYEFGINPYSYDGMTVNRAKNLFSFGSSKSIIAKIVTKEDVFLKISKTKKLKQRISKFDTNETEENIFVDNYNQWKGESDMEKGKFSLQSLMTAVIGDKKMEDLEQTGKLTDFKEAVASKLQQIDPELVATGAGAAIAGVIILDLVRDWYVYLRAQQRVGDQIADNRRTFKAEGLDIAGTESPKLATVKSLISKYGQNSSIANINHNGNIFMNSSYHIDGMIKEMTRREREIVIEYFIGAVSELVSKGYNKCIFKVLCASTPVEGEMIEIEPKNIGILERMMDFIEIDTFYPPMRLSLADLYCIVAAAERS